MAVVQDDISMEESEEEEKPVKAKAIAKVRTSGRIKKAAK